MSVKIPILIGLGLSTVSLATWSGFAFKDNYQYNKKMEKYSKWREEFFEKYKNLDDLLMCKNKLEKECKGGKGYLPNPNENKDWEEVYKNFQNDRTAIPNINSFEDLKSYCYEEVRKNLLGKDQNGYKEFYPIYSAKERHDLCVLNPYPATH